MTIVSNNYDDDIRDIKWCHELVIASRIDDIDMTGISLQDLHTIFLGLGFQPPTTSMEDLQKLLPTTTTKSIDINSALNVLMQFNRNRRDDMAQGFRLLDRDGKGYLTVEDMMQLSQDIGDAASNDAVAQELVSIAATDCNDRVSFVEFCQIMTPPDRIKVKRDE